MIFGYAPVSTSEQDALLQIDALNRIGCERIYAKNKSGAQKDRPELSRCLETLRYGDTLVVWRLDRLRRSLQKLVEIINDIEVRGIGFKSITESIDTTTAGGKLVFHLFAALSEFELALMQKCTNAGLEAASARGRRVSDQRN